MSILEMCRLENTPSRDIKDCSQVKHTGNIIIYIYDLILFNITRGIWSEIPEGTRKTRSFKADISNSERLKCACPVSLTEHSPLIINFA